MTKHIAIETFSRDPLACLDQAARGHGGVVITQGGNNVAALVSMRAFKTIERVQAQLDQLCDKLALSFADVPEEEGLRLIDEACKLARQEVAAEWRASGRLP